jgi:hypothetical protein
MRYKDGAGLARDDLFNKAFITALINIRHFKVQLALFDLRNNIKFIQTIFYGQETFRDMIRPGTHHSTFSCI